MKYNPMTRRMFLQGAGSSLLAMPFLTSLLPRECWADSALAPRRFISILTQYDYGHHSNWFPNTSGSISNLVQPANTFDPGGGQGLVRWQPLRNFAPTSSSVLSQITGTSISPYLESINMLRSLDLIARGAHDASETLGGMSMLGGVDLEGLRLTPSIDHILNASSKVNPNGLPLVLAGTMGGSGNYISMAPFKDGSIPATSMGMDLLSIFNQLFAKGTHPEGGQLTLPHPKADILNRVIEDFRRVRNSRNISSSDKIALDNAADKISDFQKGLVKTATSMCQYKSIPTTGYISEVAEKATVGKALADLIAASIMCDTARVFTIGTDMSYGVHDGESFDHQTTSHRPFDVVNGKPQWSRMGARYAAAFQNIFAPLVKDLASATDPVNGKSYLYNSLVFKSGESSQVHGWMSRPAMLAGNAGGSIASGNYIDYADRAKGGPAEGCDGGDGLYDKNPGSPTFSNNYRGALYNRLLVTIMQAMGLSPSDYERDSDNAQLYGRTDIGAQNANLTSIGGYGSAYRFNLASSGWTPSTYKADIKYYDLKTFRLKLPML